MDLIFMRKMKQLQNMKSWMVHQFGVRKNFHFENLFVSRKFHLGESIPIRLFLGGYDVTPTMKDVQRKFSVRYFLNLVLIDEEERRYFKQHVRFDRISSY